VEHRWHIERPGESDAVLAISAARIVVTHSGGVLFIDSAGELIFAMAPTTWTSVERVPNTVTEDAA
jgi:hypothetical protein